MVTTKKRICNVTKDTGDVCEPVSTKKYLAYVVPITVVLALVIFAVVQYIGERLGFLPIITVSGTAFFTSGESIIVFIVVLGASILLAMLIVYWLRRRTTG